MIHEFFNEESLVNDDEFLFNDLGKVGASRWHDSSLDVLGSDLS
jgi:hypothetical protein